MLPVHWDLGGLDAFVSRTRALARLFLLVDRPGWAEALKCERTPAASIVAADPDASTGEILKIS